MRVFLLVMGLLAALLGGFVLQESKSAVHEIEALIAFLIFTVAMGSIGIMSTVIGLQDAVARSAEQAARTICAGCSAMFTGGGAVVTVEGEQKRVCPSCAKALMDDAKS